MSQIEPITFRSKREWDAMFNAEMGLMVQVCSHSERSEMGNLPLDLLRIIPERKWCTYLILSDFKRRWDDPITRNPFLDAVWHDHSPLEGLAGWNGGPTYTHRDTSNDSRYDGRRTLTMGDDYSHSWDEDRHGMFDETYMQGRILCVAKQAAEVLNALVAKDKEVTP